MTKIILHGINGKMGKVLKNIIGNMENAEVVAGIDNFIIENHDNFNTYDSFNKCTEKADVIIDFSHKNALKSILEYAVNKKTPVVLASTGYDENDELLIIEASKEIPIFKSRNMSYGVNVLIKLLKEAAILLENDFDIEVIEKHHNQKVDAPSGTALMLVEALENSLTYDANKVYNRHGINEKRDKKDIGIHAIRGGTIVGEHNVIFAGNEEIIELKHSALSRDVFAQGAIKAAVFLAQQKNGLYSMEDMIK